MTQGHRYASSRCFNINSFHQVVVWVRCLFNPLSCFVFVLFWYMTCPIWWYLGEYSCLFTLLVQFYLYSNCSVNTPSKPYTYKGNDDRSSYFYLWRVFVVISKSDSINKSIILRFVEVVVNADAVYIWCDCSNRVYGFVFQPQWDQHKNKNFEYYVFYKVQGVTYSVKYQTF